MGSTSGSRPSMDYGGGNRTSSGSRPSMDYGGGNRTSSLGRIDPRLRQDVEQIRGYNETRYESRYGNGNEHASSNELMRKPSSELNAEELERRRLSEAGIRKTSTSETVLNDDTSSLMVGHTVYVDGQLKGRIAYIGEVHFAKGDMAGVHLYEPKGKNNGTVGGVLYFQCEPRHGIFARLHRLTHECM